ncbi:MAG: hypothetical protein RIQ52_1513 [Pseudomonadota bacterium]
MGEGDTRILLVEDDWQTRRILKRCLAGCGWNVMEATSGAEGWARIGDWQPDLIILDLGLPDMDGISIIMQLRAFSHTPVLVLSARAEEKDKVIALNAGADDYLSKPFGMGELEARIHALLRRASRQSVNMKRNMVQLDHLMIDLARRRVVKDGCDVHLTPIEFRLLALLLDHAGGVLTHRHILHAIWGPEHIDDLHYLRIYMRHLRHKIESDPARPRYLRTEVGVGYRWVEDH